MFFNLLKIVRGNENRSLLQLTYWYVKDILTILQNVTCSKLRLILDLIED